MKKYQKPELKQVELVAAQQVLENCKSVAVSAGPLAQYGGANCEPGSSQCFYIGS